METTGTPGSEPHKKARRLYLLILVAILVIILGLYYFFAFTRQGKEHPGNTEAQPGIILLTRA